MEEKKYPACSIRRVAGNPRAQMYSVIFDDGISCELVERDGQYVACGTGLPWRDSADEALREVYDLKVLRKTDPEAAVAIEKAHEDVAEKTRAAIKAVTLCKGEKGKFAVYSLADIKYEVVPRNKCGKAFSTHLPIFERKKYYFKAEDKVVYAFTPLESFFGFRLLLGEGTIEQPVMVATRCIIDGVDGECVLVAEYARSADADWLENASPFDELGTRNIWTECPSFNMTAEDAEAGRGYCSPRLVRFSWDNCRVEHKEPKAD